MIWPAHDHAPSGARRPRSDENLFANLNPIMLATEEMGIRAATIYRATMVLGPGMDTLHPDGELDEPATRIAAKALVRSIEIVCRHDGIGERR